MENFKKELIDAKMKKAVWVGRNGELECGTSHQIRAFIDVCDGVDIEKILRNKFKEHSIEEIRTILNFFRKNPLD